MQNFIDPKSLARVKDMPLIAKAVAEGFLHGVQSSMQRGVGIEFSQYRAYEVGDQLSHIDWKLFARSDRYYVREAERESEIDVWFLLDASRSMLQKSSVKKANQATPPTASWDKFEYAKHLIASLSYIAQKQGDSFGYLGMSSKQLNFVPSGNSERHWRRILLMLAQTQTGDYFANSHLLQQYINQLQKPAIIFVLSDFYQRQQEITNFIKQLNSSLCEVIALQLSCDDEVEFNYQGALRFRDLETAEEILVSASKARKNYLHQYQAYQQQLDEILAKSNIGCYRFNIDQPLDSVLFEYLRQRNRLGR